MPAPEKDRQAAHKATVYGAIEEIGIGWQQFYTLCLAGGIFIVEGALLVIAGIVVRTLEVRWGHSLAHTTLLVTGLFIGITFGTICGGFVSDTQGRRKVIVQSYGGTLVCVLLCVAGMHWVYLFFSNILLGFFFGYGVPAANTLVCETCPVAHRSNMVCSAAMCFALGQLVAGAIVYIVSPYMDYEELNWRTMTALSAIIPATYGPLAYLYLIESPSWLLVNGRTTEAYDTLQTMARRNNVKLNMETAANAAPRHSVQSHTKTSEPSDEHTTPRPGGGTCGWFNKMWEKRISQLFTPKYKSTTIILAFVTFSSNFSYYGMIYVLPDTFVELLVILEEDPSQTHLSPALALMLSALFEIPGILLAIMLSNTVSRRTSLSTAFSVTSISAISLVYASSHDSHAFVLTSMAAFAGKLFIAAAFILGYLYLLEVYPTSFRATGLAFSMSVGRLGAFLIPIVAETIMGFMGSSIYVFCVIGAVSCCAAFLTLFLPYDTRNDEELPMGKCDDDVNTPLIPRQGGSDLSSLMVKKE